MSEKLAATARDAGIAVVAGITERAGEQLYNAAILLSSRGERLLLHRKINELNIARGLYSVGDRLGVAQTEFGSVAVNICADNWSGSLALAEAQARMGAKILLSPSAWAVPPDHDEQAYPYGAEWEESYGAIARKFGLPVVGVSNVGVIRSGAWANWNCIGCSLAVSGSGDVLMKGPYGRAAECLMVVEVPLKT